MNMFERRLRYMEEALDCCMPTHENGEDALVFEAARYSLLAGGKRIRPLLLMEFAQLFGADRKLATDFACALECIHTYSLIHDDMPCMDNDDMRRNRPTNHKVYGEAMALLAGDALLNRAYEILLHAITDKKSAGAAAYIADCAGVNGMVGGQCIDLTNEGKVITCQVLHQMHGKKTGALLKAACVGGAMLGTDDEKILSIIDEYAQELGIAFQIVDDILDVEGDSAKLGKQTGMDAEQGKNTFVSVYGLDRAKELAAQHTENALRLLKLLPENEFLTYCTEFLLKRNY